MVTLSIFVLAFALALYLHDMLTLPFSNPWGIVGALPSLKYNPNNDILRFLFLISLPSVILTALCVAGFAVNRHDVNDAKKSSIRSIRVPHPDPGLSKFIVYSLVIVGLFLKAGTTTYRSQELDTYHEGETLGPAIDYLNGKVPYKDTIFIHGAFHEPLRSVLAFKLFGRSIAALRTMEAILGIITMGLLFLALYILYSRNIYYTALSLIPLLIINEIRPYGVMFRITYIDIPFLLLLILAVCIHGAIRGNSWNYSKRKVSILLFLFTFVPTLCFANSIDRGFFLFTASSIYSLILYVVFLRHADPKYIWPLLAGYALGIAGFGAAIKWAYLDFLKYISVLLRYEPLMNGFVYPFTDFRFLAPVLLISFNVYWLIRRLCEAISAKHHPFLEKVKEFFVDFFVEIFLCLLSIFYFRKALGRSETAHLAGVLFPIVMLTGYLVMKHYLTPLLRKSRQACQIFRGLSVLTLVFFFFVVVPKVDWAKWYRLPLGIPDNQFIPEKYLKTISYLKTNLGDDEEFLTLTSEASWYYYLNKPCPIRFGVIYQAMPPFYQEEIVSSLIKDSVKFVIYRNDHWANEVDGFGLQERTPLIVKYIEENFVIHKKIDYNEIWIKKMV